MLDFCDFNSEG